MQEQNWLAERFEANRGHLRGVAYRMLGSLGEAEDAVQEAWLRLARTGADEVENLKGWLTTVVARVCLDMLRSRKSLREESIDARPVHAAEVTPEQEAVMADSVGLALLVVLERLNPAERLAFVLHDLFAVPFEEIAGIVGRSAEATRQLASRARRRVQGVPPDSAADLRSQRELVDAFLAALRAEDVDGLLEVLDPELVFRADARSAAGGEAVERHGAEGWARQAVLYAKATKHATIALVDGAPAAILAPRGRLTRVMKFTFTNGKIATIEIIGDRERIAEMEISVA